VQIKTIPHPRPQITWTWLCSRGKNDINTVRFLTQTARFVSQAINVYLRWGIV
ncbi:hypothetical protein PO909_008429, partial [Leuciscus waleckii]